jgi:imidazolonepropionase-like amidohydrolase
MKRRDVLMLGAALFAAPAFAQQTPRPAAARPAAPNAPPEAEPDPGPQPAPTPKAARGVRVAVVSGKVVTNDGAPMDGATVLFADGKIVAVGRGIAVPAGYKTIDAKGKWVTPGVFAPFSRLGIMEVELEDSANDARVRTVAIPAAADAASAFDPAAIPIAVTRVEGVTRAAVAPIGGPSPICGFGLTADLSGDDNSISRAKAFLYVEAGEMGASRAGQSRMTLWPYLDAAFSDAAGVPMRYMSHSEGIVLRRSEAEALVPVLRGRIPMLIRVERASDIRQVLALKRKRPELKINLLGCSEAWRLAPELAAAGVGVIVSPVENLPGSFETLGSRNDNAAILAKAGVKVAIGSAPGSDEGHQVRLTPQLAGNAVAHGMDWDDAFKAITLAPAEIYGLANAGRLRPGFTADVVVWDGDPLEVMTSAEAVYIAGAPIALDSRQTRLRDRYLDVKNADEKPFQYR